RIILYPHKENSMMTNWREEKDSLGVLQVPAGALYQAQTQRAVDNFPISGIRMPARFIAAVALIKETAAVVNVRLGLLDAAKGEAIRAAARRVVDGEFGDQ